MDCFRRYYDHDQGDDLHYRQELSGIGLDEEKCKHAADDIRDLFCMHGDIVFGERGLTQCVAWRAEANYLPAAARSHRYAGFVHVFQGRGEGYGRYLGYTTIRPWVNNKQWQEHLLLHPAVAYMAPPSYMLRPRYHLISCLSGSADGILPFRCVPFVTPNQDLKNKAQCLYAALHAALLLKTQAYGARLISSRDMLLWLWQLDYRRQSASPPGIVKKIPAPHPLKSYADEGVFIEDAQEIIRDKCAGTLLEVFTPDYHSLDYRQATHRLPGKLNLESFVKLEAIRCLTDYVANGMPIIMDYQVNKDNGNPVGHFVLVVGMHLLQDCAEDIAAYFCVKPAEIKGMCVHEMPGRFVVHDIVQGPFHEIPTIELIQRGWRRSVESGAEGMKFMVIAPRNARVGVSGLRLQTARHVARCWPDGTRRQGHWALWEDYCDRYKLLKPVGKYDLDGNGCSRDLILTFLNFRFVTRLYRSEQVAQRYFSFTNRRRAAQHQRRLDQQACASKFHSLANIHGPWWWSVEVYARNIGEDYVGQYSRQRVPPMYVILVPIQGFCKRTDTFVQHRVEMPFVLTWNRAGDANTSIYRISMPDEMEETEIDLGVLPMS
jgi:hypothetical protein